MDLIKALQKEFAEEAGTTRKFLKLVPDDKYDWAPHEKSMKMKQLAVHIAELPSWIAMAVNTDELDFASSPYESTPVNNNAALLDLFDKSFQAGNTELKNLKEGLLDERWVLRNGDTIYWEGTKYEMIRHSFSQTSHHRAQLGVYLRLLNIPIPGSYGPSADENSFT